MLQLVGGCSFVELRGDIARPSPASDNSLVAQLFHFLEDWKRGEGGPRTDWIEENINLLARGNRLLERFGSADGSHASTVRTVDALLASARDQLPATFVENSGKQILEFYERFTALLAEGRASLPRYDAARAPRSGVTLCYRIGRTELAELLEPGLRLAGAYGPVFPSPKRMADLAMICRGMIKGNLLVPPLPRQTGGSAEERLRRMAHQLAEEIGDELQAVLVQSFAEGDTGMVQGEMALRRVIKEALDLLLDRLARPEVYGDPERRAAADRWYATGIIAEAL